MFQGIRLTKVNTKWSRIHYVDAAFEVPYKNVVYLFEGNVHRDFLGFHIFKHTQFNEYCEAIGDYMI